MRLLAFLFAMILVGSWTPALARSGEIALTFDDLPALTILQSQTYVDYLTASLLRGLKRHHITATGFVNEGKLEQDKPAQTANLAKWLDAGMSLGNHTYGHVSPNDVGANAYIADILRGEPVTKMLLTERGETMRWFRHPYLATGATSQTRHQIDTWLADHGYRIAPVTIDADDWEFAEPYDDAIARHDGARQKRIRDAYLSYTAMRIGWSQASARALFGHDIAHVMLLHGTRLNADTLDALAKLLRRARLHPVKLDQAMRDPAYRTRDNYVGANGINWLERWSLTLHKSLPSEGDIDPPKWIQSEYDKVDNDRSK